jgi:N-acetylglucosaminyldiphosphoundecaprenol N-acetyl-beta-D-mannosaminyltransferase
LRTQRAVPVKVFFFGGPDGVARNAGDVLNADNGAMRCVGARSPGFGSIEDMSSPELIAEINASGADLLVVALGAKRGQAWIEHNLPALAPALVSHLGAVVNFVAGTVARAPGLMGRLGLEWLWRIKEEPALWRRYWSDGVALLRLAAFKVLPGALAAARDRRATRVVPELRLSQDGALTRISLSGDWREADLPPLRQALTNVAARGHHVVLDLGNTDRIDSALVGLLMLLFGHQSRARRGFSIADCSAGAERTLRLACADYLLDTALTAAPASASAPLPAAAQHDLPH